MKTAIIPTIFLLGFGFTKAQTQAPTNTTDLAYSQSALKFSDLNEDEKTEAIEAHIGGNCEYKGLKS